MKTKIILLVGLLLLQIMTIQAQTYLPITVSESKGKTQVQLGARKFTITRAANPQGIGFLKLTGSFHKGSLSALANRPSQNQFYFPFSTKELTASLVVHIPGVGLAGLSSADARHFLDNPNQPNRALNARIAWIVYEDDVMVVFPGHSEYLFLYNLHPNLVTADRVLYFGQYQRGDFETKKFRKSTAVGERRCYVSLYEGNKRVHLWQDAKDLLINPSNSSYYRTQREHLSLRVGGNKSAIFVDHHTAYVIDSTLTSISAYPGISLVAANDGSSSTAFALHDKKSISTTNKDFGPYSTIKYNIFVPTEHDGYYRVLDHNGIPYAPENSIGLLPFYSTYPHIRKYLKKELSLNKISNDFEIMYFLMAAYVEDDDVLWQMVDFNGRPFPGQEEEFFLGWRTVPVNALYENNYINALRVFIMTHSPDGKYQAYFPWRCGISHKMLNQPGHLAKLSGKHDNPLDAYDEAEDNVMIIQKDVNASNAKLAAEIAKRNKEREERRIKENQAKRNFNFDLTPWINQNSNRSYSAPVRPSPSGSMNYYSDGWNKLIDYKRYTNLRDR